MLIQWLILLGIIATIVLSVIVLTKVGKNRSNKKMSLNTGQSCYLNSMCDSGLCLNGKCSDRGETCFNSCFKYDGGSQCCVDSNGKGLSCDTDQPVNPNPTTTCYMLNPWATCFINGDCKDDEICDGAQCVKADPLIRECNKHCTMAGGDVFACCPKKNEQGVGYCRPIGECS